MGPYRHQTSRRNKYLTRHLYSSFYFAIKGKVIQVVTTKNGILFKLLKSSARGHNPARKIILIKPMNWEQLVPKMNDCKGVSGLDQLSDPQ